MMKIVQEQLKGKHFDIVLCIYFANYDISRAALAPARENRYYNNL